MNRSFSEGGGSIRLFRIFGIQVFLHWSWLLVAIYEIQQRGGGYSNPIWNAVEYVALFAIVLLHEFGHALACRSVGGQADRIVLWPLGGVAFVAPPPRPGAVLWSIVAGPLVNVALVPVLWLAGDAAANGASNDLVKFLDQVFWLNVGILIFNLLPIYPLDGGKIVWSLLWFLMGRGPALRVAGVIGLIGAAGFVGLAIYLQSVWIGVLAVFGLMQSWSGLKTARAMDQIDSIPRHADAQCPACGTHPLRTPTWRCQVCGIAFDPFEYRGSCPQCGKFYDAVPCASCGHISPIGMWYPMPGFPMQPPPPPMGETTISGTA